MGRSSANRKPLADSRAAEDPARVQDAAVGPESLTLETRLQDELRVPDIPIGAWGVDELRESFRRLSIESELNRESGDLVLRYECTIRDAIRLGYDQGGKRELITALLNTYPELSRNEVALERRIRKLKREREAEEALELLKEQTLRN